MRITSLAIVVALLVAAPLIGADDTPARNPAEKPAAEPARQSTWHDCKVGSYARYRVVTTVKEDDGTTRTRVVLITYLVKHADDDGVGIEVTTRVQGESRATVSSEYVAHKTDNSPIVKDPSVKLGGDTVKVPAGSFACRWAEESGDGTTSRVYVNPQVPGHYVKSVQTRESGFKGSTVMELLAYSKK
ncbi:MAG: hypothetical protein GC159_17160 [Phycisphaera sp.]|nr:hypothetical protein [Phycisphaera sp.]